MFQLPMSLLEPVARVYLPEEHWSLFQFTDKSLAVNCSNGKVNIYGSGDEIVQHIQAFGMFPGSVNKFQMDLTLPYDMHPLVCTGSEGKEYMYKQDILAMLQQFVRSIDFGIQQQKFVYPILAYFLRTKDNRLKNHCEFVLFDDNKINNFKAKLLSKAESIAIPTSGTKSGMTLDKVFKKLKEVLPVNENDPEYNAVLKVLQKLDKESPVKKDSKMYENLLEWISMIIEEYNMFIESNPKWFLPQSESAQESDDPIIVRLFDDGSKKFAMLYELLPVIKECGGDVESITETINSKGIIQTIEIRNPCHKFEEKFENVEFVAVQIKRTKHSAVYIPSFNGKYCILSADLLFEILHDIISVKSLFQKVEKNDWKKVLPLFEDLENIFHCSMKEPCFIDTEEAKKIKSVTSQFLKSQKQLSMKSTKNVRNVGSTGFNLNDLKKELQFLGLTKSFSNITDYAVNVYNIVNERKNTNVLRTCDMYDALEQCQLMCVLLKFPKLNEFLHLQDACNRLPMKCSFCLKQTMSEAKQKSTNPNSDAVYQKYLPMKSEEVSQGTSSSEVNQSEIEKKNEKKEKNIKATEKKKMEKQEPLPSTDSNVTENKSNVCAKCFRTSESCNKANEKLRLERIKTKALQKELTEVTLRELKKEEENKKLRQKLALLERAQSNSAERLVIQNSNLPSTSTTQHEYLSEPEKQEPIVFKASNWKTSELTSEMRNMLFELLNTRDCLQLENPMQQATIQANKLITSTNKKSYKNGATYELKKFYIDYKRYYEAIETSIEMIRNKKILTLDQLPALPEFPSFSENFMKAYNEVVIGDELEDQECVICLVQMESEEDTIKCKSCKRRYHNGCASKWKSIKNQCPICETELNILQ